MNPNAAHLGYQNFDIRLNRRFIGATVALGALLLPAACAADTEGTPIDPAPSVSQPFEPEPTPSEKPEFRPTATGTYEDFAAAMDTPPLDNLGYTMLTTDKDGRDTGLTCNEIVAWDAGQGIALPDFDPTTDFPVCDGETLLTDMRALSAFFSNIETFVNSDAFPDGTDADIKVGVTVEVGRAIYDQYDGYRRGEPGYERVQDHDELVEIVAFSADQAYGWKNGMHEGHELTKDEIRTIYYMARDQVYNLGQTPEELVGPAVEPNQAAHNQSGELIDQILNAEPAPNDPSKLMNVGDIGELPCSAIVGSPECTEAGQGAFNVVLDTYKGVSEQTGVDPAHTALIMFYAGVAINTGLADNLTHNDLITRASENVFTEIHPEEVAAVGEALGADDRYPTLFGAEQLTR